MKEIDAEIDRILKALRHHSNYLLRLKDERKDQLVLSMYYPHQAILIKLNIPEGYPTVPPTRELDNGNFVIHNFEDALGVVPKTDLTVTRLFLRIVHNLSKCFKTQIPPLMRALDPNFIKELDDQN
ncbi:unnamed protein product [Rodentolepis nana]|uniref:UBC core domain-containing protein n=1 Tax=Rodentolepis nana TaxID=102285 RepID=A0A0R3TA63_RODNA|nr:unnamed protein product [Rodentolepis nana]